MKISALVLALAATSAQAFNVVPKPAPKTMAALHAEFKDTDERSASTMTEAPSKVFGVEVPAFVTKAFNEIEAFAMKVIEKEETIAEETDEILANALEEEADVPITLEEKTDEIIVDAFEEKADVPTTLEEINYDIDESSDSDVMP